MYFFSEWEPVKVVCIHFNIINRIIFISLEKFCGHILLQLLSSLSVCKHYGFSVIILVIVDWSFTVRLVKLYKIITGKQSKNYHWPKNTFKQNIIRSQCTCNYKISFPFSCQLSPITPYLLYKNGRAMHTKKQSNYNVVSKFHLSMICSFPLWSLHTIISMIK